MESEIEIEIDFGNDGYKVKANLCKDGNQWCCGVGLDLQVGVHGFGNSIQESIHDFKSEFRNS